MPRSSRAHAPRRSPQRDDAAMAAGLTPASHESAAAPAAATGTVSLVAVAPGERRLGACAIAGLDAARRRAPAIAAVAPGLNAGAVADLVRPIARDEADIVFAVPERAGSIDRLAARWFGTPRAALEWQAMAASPRAVARLPYRRNADGALFACELALQAAMAGLRIAVVPAATRALPRPPRRAQLAAVLRARVQVFHIFHDRRFDLAAAAPSYEAKLGYKTPHTIAALLVRAG